MWACYAGPPRRVAHFVLATCSVTQYIESMIKSFRHAGLEKFYKSGSKAGIQPAHAPKLKLLLSTLDQGTRAESMNLPGWDWHPLKGELEGQWSVKVNANWRLTFSFDGEDATLADSQDDH